MSEYINEITNYFSNLIDHLNKTEPEVNHTIGDLSEDDQLIYYKLNAIINGYSVIHGRKLLLSWEDIIKIKCMKLFCDYKHKYELRAVDVIVAGDYPKLLFKILFKESFVNLDRYYDLAVGYDRFKCLEMIQSIVNIKKDKILSHEVLDVIQNKILI